MKIKCWYFFGVSVALSLFVWILISQTTAHKLKKKYQSMGLIPIEASVDMYATNLSGSALVLYNISHEDYPNLNIHRLFIQNDSENFELFFSGIHGSLLNYLQLTQPYAFQQELIPYNPAQDLLQSPLLTLAILGYDDLNVNFSIKAIRTAPNQIIVEESISIGNQPQMHAVAKLAPPQPNASVFENLKDQILTFNIDFLSDNWKEKLENYALSKNLPFPTENRLYKAKFLQHGRH